MVHSLGLGSEVDGVAVYSRCTKRKYGDGRGEAEECDSNFSCHPPLADGPC